MKCLWRTDLNSAFIHDVKTTTKYAALEESVFRHWCQLYSVKSFPNFLEKNCLLSEAMHPLIFSSNWPTFMESQLAIRAGLGGDYPSNSSVSATLVMHWPEKKSLQSQLAAHLASKSFNPDARTCKIMLLLCSCYKDVMRKECTWRMSAGNHSQWCLPVSTNLPSENRHAFAGVFQGTAHYHEARRSPPRNLHPSSHCLILTPAPSCLYVVHGRIFHFWRSQFPL